MMGIQLIEQGRLVGLEKFLALGTVCAYPKFTPAPFHEENLLGWVSRGNQRALLIGKEDAVGAIPGLSRPVWVQLDLCTP